MPDFRWCPFSQYSPTFWEWESQSCEDEFMLCTINGEPAWSDGRMLCLGSPPGPIRETPIESAHTARLLKEAESATSELKPLAVAEFGSDRAVILFEPRRLVNAKFINVVREKWPGVRLFAPEDQTKPIVARIPIIITLTNPSEMSAAALDAGALNEQVESLKVVALIMGLRFDDWQERIEEILGLLKEHAHV